MNKVAYIILDQEPTTEQYFVSAETPETIRISNDGEKYIIKFDVYGGIPSCFAGKTLYNKYQIKTILKSPEWIEEE